MKKRILSVLLVLSMMLGVMNVTAFASEESPGENNSENIKSGTAFDVNTESVDIKNTDDENNIQNADTGHVHAYGEPMWSWNDYHATAAFTCTCGDVQNVEATVTNEVTTAATETVPGVRTYTAAVTFFEREYIDTETEEIQATGVVLTDNTVNTAGIDGVEENIVVDGAQNLKEENAPAAMNVRNAMPAAILNETPTEPDLTTEDGIKAAMMKNGYKFMAVLASMLSGGSVDAVVGAVDANYRATLTLPSSANSGSAFIGVGMQNVASMGVNDAKAHVMPLRNSTGSDVSNLSTIMPHLYGFQGATVTATIVDANGVVYPVTYTISGATNENGKTVITANPSDNVSTAWHAMVNNQNFAVSTAANPDSFITIANGSWLQIGDQLLRFENGYTGDLKLDNIANFAGIDSEIRNAVELVWQDYTSVSFHLAAGTTLAVSSSSAVLTKPVTVNMTGAKLDGSILTELRSGQINGLTALFAMMDSILVAAENKTINVTMRFGDTAAEPKNVEGQVQEIISGLLKSNKFVAIVASQLNNYEIAQLVGTVDAGYNATLKLPQRANAGNVTIGVGMANVASMGIDNPKIHTKYLETGLTAETEVNGFASTLYGFNGTTITANIKKGTDEAKVTYAVSGAQNNVITATPTVTNGTINDAWKLLVKDNFEFQTDKPDDSYIVITNGSWLQIGNDLLVFENDQIEDLKLDNITIGNLSSLNQTIRDAVKLIQADDTSAVKFHLAKGTELAVSSSSAKLTEDVTVTVDGVTLPENVANILTNLRNAQGTDAKNAIQAMFGLMNGMLSAVNDNSVTVTIEFGEEPEEPAGYNIRSAVERELENAKFVGIVASTLTDGTTTEVVGTVDKDYKATLTIPNAYVNPNSLYLGVGMKDVSSLGGGQRVHGIGEIKLLGNKDQQDLPLFNTLNTVGGSLAGFTGANVSATIKAPQNGAVAKKDVTYTLTSKALEEKDLVRVITAVPSEGVADAWHLMVNDQNFAINNNTDNDSKIVIAKGSWLQIGDKKLQFTQNANGNINLLSSTNADTIQTILDKVELVNVAEDAPISFYLTKGTELAVSSSSAKLARDVKVTITGVSASDFQVADSENFLVSLQRAVNQPNFEPKSIIIQLAVLLDKAVGAVNNKSINVEIEFICDHTPAAAVEDNRVEATCAKEGSYDEVVYCSVCGEELSRGSKNIEKLAHSYGQPAWTWSPDHTSATATFTCTNAGCTETQAVTVTGDAITSEITRTATETADGKRTYTATVTFDGKTYTGTATETIPALSHTHSYNGPVWSWNGATATAVFTCACGDTQTVIAAVSSAVTTPATATTNGVRTYTATVVFNGNTYTTTTTATIPATGTGPVVPTLPDTYYFPNTYSTPNTPSAPSTSNTPANPPVEITDPETPLTDRPFPFVDVNVGDWFYEDVKSAYEMYLMDGVSDTRFDPQGNTTRGMVAMILYRMEGEPSIADYSVTIPDLKDSDWYHDAAIWAYATGAYEGYEDGSFRGNDLVTREQLATVLYRYASQKGYDVSDFNDLSAFVDKNDVSNWALAGAQWSVGAELIKGRDGNRIAPAAHTTRAELATILVRFVERFDTK